MRVTHTQIFQRRHFEFLASMIRQMDEDKRSYVAFEMADKLKATNHRFDERRFINEALGTQNPAR